jgi:hypothetical protein
MAAESNSRESNPALSNWGMYFRYMAAFIFVIILFAGVGLQIFSAGNLYNVPLSSYCQAYSGTPDFSTTVSFKELANTALAKRQTCLALNGTKRDSCCSLVGGYSGLCASPGVNVGIGIKSNGTIGSAQSKMRLMTELLGNFFGVSSASRYDEANAEFWCKNCPNDVRKNCPFKPTDSGSAISDAKLCSCPGGVISKPGQAFWATIGDAALASDFIRCSDKAVVYKAWIQALFPEFTTNHLDQAAGRFLTKCYQGRAVVGYILVIGPALGLVSGMFSVASLFPALANSVVPAIGFQITMLAVALEFVAFWPLSFTGAASLISRYSFCAGLSYPVVLNASAPKASIASSTPRAAPVFYNGSPCYDLNSEGQHAENPFVQQVCNTHLPFLFPSSHACFHSLVHRNGHFPVLAHTALVLLVPHLSPHLQYVACMAEQRLMCCVAQLGVFNAGFLTGGVLVIVSLVLLLAILSRHADAVFERKLAGKPSGSAKP